MIFACYIRSDENSYKGGTFEELKLFFRNEVKSNTMAKRFNLLILLVFCLTGAAFLACETPEEQEINATVSEGIETFESADLTKLIKFGTRDFVAYPGKLDRKTIVRRLYLAMKNQKDIRVLHPIPDIEIE